MSQFVIISEGTTDQIIIDNILAGYFKSGDINIKFLQPSRDETDKNKSTNYGGWGLVLQHCQPQNLTKALQLNQYIIIHIDTDVSQQYGVAKQNNKDENYVEITIKLVIQKLISIITEDFYSKYHERIIFAIAVECTECWLLPLYAEKDQKGNFNNCLFTLNKALGKKGLPIIEHKKDERNFQKLSKDYSKNKIFNECYEANPSFKIFIEEIQKRNITLEDVN
jgi:hypothetical protein